MKENKVQKKEQISSRSSVSSKNKFLTKIREDPRFRLRMTTAIKGGVNLAYTLYNLILAAVYGSWWFFTMGIYYLIACVMRASALRLKETDTDHGFPVKTVRENGVLTFVLGLVLSGIILLTIVGKKNTVYSSVIAISIAAYTFYCAVTAIINTAQLKKRKTVQLILLRNTSMVYALGSLFSLERILLGTFGDTDPWFVLKMEVVSGAGFFILIIFFGINLLLYARKNSNNSKN